MDTGSGKTHVAVLRIKHQIQISSSPKLIWLLATTIALCSQQFDVLRSQISSVQIKSFTSADSVDRWSEKAIWDDMLANTSIVVSTFAVLHEALCHGFVSIGSLALIVFDEAHNCIGRSPGSKIMTDFYWPEKHSRHYVPHILGLTASPVIGSKTEAMGTLESVLDSVCRSPHIQKEELLLHVNLPDLVRIHFEASEAFSTTLRSTSVMKNLLEVYQKLDIYADPEIISLKSQNTKSSREKMEKALKSKNTFIQSQMKTINRRAGEMCQVLGHWAADFYILQVVSTLIRSSDSKDIATTTWKDAEKRHLVNTLRNLDISPDNLTVLSQTSISDKVRALLKFLQSCDEKTTGIIFVKQRTTASLLQHLLSIHPATSKRLRFDTVVGASQQASGKRDLFEIATHKDALSRFRSGDINILIATSVLEEGIDVPRCHLVICFDEPSSLKSYIQRRGRARLPGSRWALLLENSSRDLTRQWEDLELEMKKKYENEQREVQELVESEICEEESCRSRYFRVPSTGARLDLDNAKGHLQCFCSRLATQPSLYMRPVYIIMEGNEGENRDSHQALFRAKVILPATLDPSMQVFISKMLWRSEKNAMKDAAFEAYTALYHAGLVNDHLLPLSFMDPSSGIEMGDSIVEIHEQFNPWPSIAHAWENREKLQRRVLALKDQHGLVKCEIETSIPVDLPELEPILICWDASSQWKLESGQPRIVEYCDQQVEHTATLLSLAHGHRWKVEEMRYAVVFEGLNAKISQLQLGCISLVDDDILDESMGLLRDSQNCGYPYLFHKFLSSKPSIKSVQHPHEDYESFSSNQPFVALKKWSRRSDFLHSVAAGPETVGKEYSSVLPRSRLKRDAIPTVFSQFSSIIPSFLHKIETELVVKELCSSLLADIDISDTAIIRKAISTSGAREKDDYQKLEFLGDSILKMLVSIFLASKYNHWPEGYLSAKRAAIVSNARLCKAATDRGLDKFIFTDVFTGKGWRPFYVEELLKSEENGTRRISSKLIADVVESLIGAGWKMGDFQTSLSIAQIFLPEVDMPSVEVGRVQLFDIAPVDIPIPEDLCQLESLAGYSFVKKSLIIQAMSHRSINTATASYERLEFLGDSILEALIVTEISRLEDSLPLSFMHLCKTALVNGNFLGFIALEWSITQKETCWKENHLTGVMEVIDSEFQKPLWRFMRHGMLDVGIEQQEIARRHRSLRHDILSAMESGSEYPWTLLARIQANKFYSDIVESLLGAVWIDSGSMETCRQILDLMGIIKYLHRIIKERINLLHPREELGILARGEEVVYELHASEMEDGKSGRRCKVFVGGDLIYEGDHGKNNDEAKTRAAEGAIAELRRVNESLGSRKS
ncbi:RNase3 domain-containing protein [Leptodontidium sp. 2 PMI_412]|nr:RNase3 domain-containing protein [Leptodontidium sp. 2 PMI_412]